MTDIPGKVSDILVNGKNVTGKNGTGKNGTREEVGKNGTKIY